MPAKNKGGWKTAVLLLLGATLLGSFAAAQSPEAAQPSYARDTPLTTPAIFGNGTISAGDFDSHPAFTPDGRTLYFVRSTPNFNLWTILVSRFVNGKWNTPRVAPFSGQHSDADPFVTSDGSKIYFISNRPAAGKDKPDLDIWMCESVGAGWGEPKNLGAPVNSPGSEWYPTIAANGTMYFGSDREGGKGRTDLYRCRFANAQYQPAENLGDSINTATNEFEPWIAPDESYLVFMGGGRPDSRGGFDLYLSRNVNGTWTKPVNLGDMVNTGGNEYSPAISPDGKYFFWTSTRGFADKPLDQRFDYDELMTRLRGPSNGLGDIYQIDLGALGLAR